MSSLGNIRQLTQEACSSYMAYLTYSGILNTHNAKLSLMKWPDAAISAIALVETRNPKNIEMLENDLSILVVEPIQVIYDSTLQRVIEVTKKEPAGIKEPAAKAKMVKTQDPIEAKKLLVDCINQMFGVLETVTGDRYPQLR